MESVHLQDYLGQRYHPQNVNRRHQESLKTHDKLAMLVTSAIGSMYAVYVLVLVVLGWMFWQSLSNQPFDPYPFAFLLFITNIIQLLLTPLILVGQNVQNHRDQLRAEEEFRATQSIHQDMEKTLTLLISLAASAPTTKTTPRQGRGAPTN